MNTRTAIIGFIFFFFVAGSAWPVDWYVPDHFATIQEAIDAASSGDTIMVRPGTYQERINFLGKGITLKSESGPEATIIDGRGSTPGSIVLFTTSEGPDSVLDGFTITQGRGTYVEYHQWLAAGYVGGGIYCYASSPTIINNIITDNLVGAG